MTRVVPATWADADKLSQVIADAFHDLAVSHWLIPDESARRQVSPAVFRIYVEHALACGTAHTTLDRTAVALWLPISKDGPALPVDYPDRLAAAAGPWADRFAEFDAALERHHPTGDAHNHLAILAVAPQCQGQGTGTALLRACHRALDESGMPAYLEASSPRSRDLYLRNGYGLLSGAPFHLPGGPPMWGMWRLPHRHPVPRPRA